MTDKTENIKILSKEQTNHGDFYTIEVNNVDSPLLFAYVAGKWNIFSTVFLNFHPIDMRNDLKLLAILKEAKLL